MGAHHTKDKGDLGVAKAHADLVQQGWTVLFPSTEHAPFDLVAYRDEQFRRVQVKYRSGRTGSVTVVFKSTWADRHGVHVKHIDKGAIDLVCIYCPETDQCYYLDPSSHRVSVTLRIRPSRNGQVAGVLQAAEFREVPI
jgi:hypothetical protein